MTNQSLRIAIGITSWIWATFSRLMQWAFVYLFQPVPIPQELPRKPSAPKPILVHRGGYRNAAVRLLETPAGKFKVLLQLGARMVLSYGIGFGLYYAGAGFFWSATVGIMLWLTLIRGLLLAPTPEGSAQGG
jgi:hypothetical protein